MEQNFRSHLRKTPDYLKWNQITIQVSPHCHHLNIPNPYVLDPKYFVQIPRVFMFIEECQKPWNVEVSMNYATQCVVESPINFLFP